MDAPDPLGSHQMRKGMKKIRKRLAKPSGLGKKLEKTTEVGAAYLVLKSIADLVGWESNPELIPEYLSPTQLKALEMLPTLDKGRSFLRRKLVRDLHQSKGLHPLFSLKIPLEDIYYFIDFSLKAVLEAVPRRDNPMLIQFQDAQEIACRAQALEAAIPRNIVRQRQLSKFISPNSENIFVLPLAYLKLIEKKISKGLDTRRAKNQKGRGKEKMFAVATLRAIDSVADAFSSYPRFHRQALVLNLANSATFANLGNYAGRKITVGDYDSSCRRRRKNP
jgi:hypothetical protein